MDLTIAELVAFRIVLSFKRHKDCNCWFKYNGTEDQPKMADGGLAKL